MDIHKLAENLHKKFCHWNHADGCSWYYEKDFSGQTHQDWIVKATEVVNMVKEAS